MKCNEANAGVQLLTDCIQKYRTVQMAYVIEDTLEV